MMKNWPTKESAKRKQLDKRKGKRLRWRRTKEEHKTVNGINAAVQKKGEKKRRNKRVRELTKETVGVSDSSECGKIWNTQWQNMKEWLKQKEYEKKANKSNIGLSLLSFTHLVPKPITLFCETQMEKINNDWLFFPMQLQRMKSRGLQQQNGFRSTITGSEKYQISGVHNWFQVLQNHTTALDDWNK